MLNHHPFPSKIWRLPPSKSSKTWPLGLHSLLENLRIFEPGLPWHHRHSATHDETYDTQEPPRLQFSAGTRSSSPFTMAHHNWETPIELSETAW
jgi:hypothetical protein